MRAWRLARNFHCVAEMSTAASIPLSPGAEPDEPVRRIVVESLQRELRLRRDRLPHAQLGVTVGAEAATIEKAFARLTRQFHPEAYTPHGEQAVVLAREISTLVEVAFLLLGNPSVQDDRPLPNLQPQQRSDETLRALETLRGGIARRKSEALRLKAAGRVAEARRMFEAVRALDPHDETARTQLRLLRTKPDKPLMLVWLWLWSQIRRVVKRVQTR